MKTLEFINIHILQFALDNSIAIIAFFFSIYQFRKGYMINSGMYLLELREVFLEEKKNKLHLNLRNRTSYTPEDWSVVDDYLGTFEVVGIMIKRGALDKKNIKDLYGYRVANILRNQIIFENKLVLEYKSWKNFYDLISQLDGSIWSDFYKFLSKIETQYEINFCEYNSVSDLLISLDDNARPANKSQ